MSDSDFAGMGLAPGFIRGVRAFSVDNYGRLIGPIRKTVWKPGENEAYCNVGKNPYGKYDGMIVGDLGNGQSVIYNPNTITNTAYASPMWDVKYSTISAHKDAPPKTSDFEPKEKSENKPHEHKIGSCQHGFYAFNEASDEYDSMSTVKAVIEGYGQTMIGTKGFRSQKAKIVALSVKSRGTLLERYAEWNDDWGFIPFGFGVTGGFLSVIVESMAIFTWHSPSWIIALLALAFTVCAALAIATGILSQRIRGSSVNITPQMFAKIKRNYPGVPIFDSLEKMVKAFPTEPAYEPTPENDEKFWER